jgi:hypothetical protein
MESRPDQGDFAFRRKAIQMSGPRLGRATIDVDHRVSGGIVGAQTFVGPRCKAELLPWDYDDRAKRSVHSGKNYHKGSWRSQLKVNLTVVH